MQTVAPPPWYLNLESGMNYQGFHSISLLFELYLIFTGMIEPSISNPFTRRPASKIAQRDITPHLLCFAKPR